MEPILTVTANPTVDLSLQVSELRPTGKSRAELRDVTPGGGGINVTRAVVELGGRSLAVHTAGGETGRRLERLLDDEGIDHRSVPITEETREAVVLADLGEDRSYHVVPPGPELSEDLAAALLEAVVHLAPDHGLTVVSGSLPAGVPEDHYERLARIVHDAGGRLLLDGSGLALRPALEHGVDFLRLNRSEAEQLTGTEVRELADARRVNRTVMEQGWAELVATTVGDRGAVIGTGHGDHAVRAPRLRRPVRSDAGAGDSFVAGLALGLARGLPPQDAGALAVAAAAAAVLTPGMQLCRRADAEELRGAVEVSAA